MEDVNEWLEKYEGSRLTSANASEIDWYQMYPIVNNADDQVITGIYYADGDRDNSDDYEIDESNEFVVEVGSSRIRSIREESGLSQQAFADKYSIPYKTYQKWETGENTAPQYTIDMIELLQAEEKAEARLAWFVLDEPTGSTGDIFGSDRPYLSKSTAIKEAEDEWYHKTAGEKKNRSIRVALTEMDENGQSVLDSWQDINIK